MKLKQKMLCLVLSLCLLAACLPLAAAAEDATPQGVWTDYAATTFAGGTGTKDDPYQIATAQQLALLAKDVNGGNPDVKHSGEYFVLTADIDLSDHVWKPLGYESYSSGGGSSQSFCSYFDGNGKKIVGLYVDERVGDKWGKNRNAGLFGCISAVGTEPTIKNLIIENGTVLAGDGSTDASYAAGLLVGSITITGGSNVEYAVIENCTVSGTVSSAMYAGGLVGSANYTHLTNCRADVKVNGVCVSGGFIGGAFISTLTDCIATGKVSGGWATGGFAGEFYKKVEAKHCAAFGSVEANDWNIGGFVGYTEEDVTVENSIAMGDVTSTLIPNYNPKAGGFVGTALNGVKLEKCHAAGKITTASSGNIGGMIAVGDGSSAADCSFDNEKNAALAAVGNAVSGTYAVAAQETAAVLASICVDYYGGHDMKASAAKAPTCTEDGHEAGAECARCGHREGFAVVKATGHTGGTATCKEKAICKNCNTPYGALDPHNHAALVKTEAKAATAQAEGNIAYWHCADCDKYFSDVAATTEIQKADTVTAKLQPASNGDKGEDPKSPETGDNVDPMRFVMLLLVSGGAVIAAACGRKRRETV